MTVDPRLIDLTIKYAPKVVELIQNAFKNQHPGEPVPTSAEVIAAWKEGALASLERDAQLLAETDPARPADGT